MPQIIFDIRHDGILRKNIANFVVTERSFGLPTKENIGEKLNLYGDVFSNEIFHTKSRPEEATYAILALSLLIFLPGLFKKDIFKIICLLLLSATFGLVFFKGNEGVVYDYYLTGYYLLFVFLVAIVLGHLWKFKLGKVFVVSFLYLFLSNNFSFSLY